MLEAWKDSITKTIDDLQQLLDDIPESWDDIQFLTTGWDWSTPLMPDYGHLVLGY